MQNKWSAMKFGKCAYLSLLLLLSACGTGNKTIISSKTEISSASYSLNIVIKDIVDHKEKIQGGKIAVYEFVDISKIVQYIQNSVNCFCVSKPITSQSHDLLYKARNV